jgi:hypothetical protein
MTDPYGPRSRPGITIPLVLGAFLVMVFVLAVSALAGGVG